MMNSILYIVVITAIAGIGGTGLGLSIVKHGAKFLGATISIESREGEGTTVRVLF